MADPEDDFIANSGDVPVAAGGGQSASDPVNTPPPGFTLIAPGLASAPNPVTGGVVYMTFDNLTRQWQYQAGATQPPSANVSTGPSFTGIPESELVKRAQASGGTIKDYGIYKVITYPDGSVVRADPSLGPGGQLYYNVSIQAPSSSTTRAPVGIPQLSAGATAGGAAAVSPIQASGAGGSTTIGGMPTAFPAAGTALTLGKAVPNLITRDTATGALLSNAAQYNPGTEIGGILQRNNPFITPSGGIATSAGSPQQTYADMGRNLAVHGGSLNQEVIRAYGGTPTADPIANAAAADYLHQASTALISQGYTPIQAQQYLQMQQQVGRTTDPFQF